MAVSVGTMELKLMSIMQVTTSAAFIYAGLEVVLSVTGILVDLSVAIMHVTVSVPSAAPMQVTVSAANM